MWHEKSEMGPIWPLFFVLAALVRGHYVVEKIVVRVGVGLRATQAFMTKPYGHVFEPSAVVVEPRCACVAKVMDASARRH